MITNIQWLAAALNDYHELYNELPRWKLTKDGTFSMQLIGCEIVLLKNGHWFMNDTSGG